MNSAYRTEEISLAGRTTHVWAERQRERVGERDRERDRERMSVLLANEYTKYIHSKVSKAPRTLPKMSNLPRASVL